MKINNITQSEIISRVNAKALGLTYYFTGKPCKYGHIAPRLVSASHCVECRRLYMEKYTSEKGDKIKEKKKEYYQENKQRIANKNKLNSEERKQYNREYYRRNKNKENQRAKKWKNSNKQKVTDYGRKWYEENKSHVLEYNREYRLKNPDQYFIRRSLDRIFNGWSGSIKEMEELHGYTMSELHLHIESLFKPGMSWLNRSEWHIDHIIPISAWLALGIKDVRLVNALDNLQPLWATENLSKSNKVESPN